MHELHRLSGLTAPICYAEPMPGIGDVGARPFMRRTRPSGSDRKTTQL